MKISYWLMTSFRYSSFNIPQFVIGILRVLSVSVVN